MPAVTHGPIVGATTADSVTIWLRAEDTSFVEIRLALEAGSLPEESICSACIQLDQDLDCTGVVTLTELKADTLYHYAVLIDGKQVLPDDEFTELSFRTFPEPGSACESFSFAFGSCFRPHYQNIGDGIFRNLAPEYGPHGPRFFLMIGDNVYVDDLYEQYVLEGQPQAWQSLQQLYYKTYRDTWKYSTFRRALMNTPTFMMFDDHEYWNNWGNEPEHQFDSEGLPTALQAYRAYQDSHNPDAETRHGADSEQYHYTFSYGDVGFFVLDCRTRRNPSAKPYRTMLGSEQREALIDWLIDNNDRYRVKFIISSVPVTFIALPHWFVNLVHGGLGDQWLGYPAERLTLFSVIKQKKITGVHFLSGDIHLGQGVVIKSQEGQAPDVYAYASSPLANTSYLLPEEAPSWSSALAGGLLGATAGLLVGLVDSQKSVRKGLFRGLLIGAAAGELLRRFLNFWRPPKEHNKPGHIGSSIYMKLNDLIQHKYAQQLRGVAEDKIQGEKLLYQPENLFKPVFQPNIGRVTVTRNGEEIKVQFTLLDECGNPIGEEAEPHTVS